MLPKSLEAALLDQEAYKNGSMHFRLDVGGTPATSITPAMPPRHAFVGVLGFTAREGTVEVPPRVLSTLMDPQQGSFGGRWAATVAQCERVVP